MKNNEVLPDLLGSIIAKIPLKDRERILNEKKGMLSRNKKSIRLQPFMPLDVYVLLVYFGGFRNSESDFFCTQAVNWIEEQAVRLKMLDKILVGENGGR